MTDFLVDKREMTFGAAERLSVYTPEYQFFTPAILYLYGRMTDRVLAEFTDWHGKPFDWLYHRFDYPVFGGLAAPNGDAEWNNVLLAVKSDVWPHLESFLLSLVLHAKGESWMVRIGAQDLTIVDPLSLVNGLVATQAPPRVPVVALGVSATWGCAAFNTDGGPASLPVCQRYPPQRQTLQYAKLVGKDELEKAMEVIAPAFAPADAHLPDLRVVGLENMSPAEQAEYRKAIEEYRQLPGG